MLESLGAARVIDESELERLIEDLDANRDGDISYTEFVDLLDLDNGEPEPVDMTAVRAKIMTQVRKSKFDLRAAFEVFDADKSGSMPMEEFQAMMKLVGVEIDASELDALMACFDANGDGFVDYDEFCSFVKGEKEVVSPVQSPLAAPPRVCSTVLQEDRPAITSLRRLQGPTIALSRLRPSTRSKREFAGQSTRAIRLSRSSSTFRSSTRRRAADYGFAGKIRKGAKGDKCAPFTRRSRAAASAH